MNPNLPPRKDFDGISLNEMLQRLEQSFQALHQTVLQNPELPLESHAAEIKKYLYLKQGTFYALTTLPATQADLQLMEAMLNQHVQASIDASAALAKLMAKSQLSSQAKNSFQHLSEIVVDLNKFLISWLRELYGHQAWDLRELLRGRIHAESEKQLKKLSFDDPNLMDKVAALQQKEGQTLFDYSLTLEQLRAKAREFGINPDISPEEVSKVIQARHVVTAAYNQLQDPFAIIPGVGFKDPAKAARASELSKLANDIYGMQMPQVQAVIQQYAPMVAAPANPLWMGYLAQATAAQGEAEDGCPDLRLAIENNLTYKIGKLTIDSTSPEAIVYPNMDPVEAYYKKLNGDPTIAACREQLISELDTLCKLRDALKYLDCDTLKKMADDIGLDLTNLPQKAVVGEKEIDQATLEMLRNTIDAVPSPGAEGAGVPQAQPGQPGKQPQPAVESGSTAYQQAQVEGAQPVTPQPGAGKTDNQSGLDQSQAQYGAARGEMDPATYAAQQAALQEQLIQKKRTELEQAPGKRIQYDAQGNSYEKLLPDGTIYTFERKDFGSDSYEVLQEWTYADGKKASWKRSYESQGDRQGQYSQESVVIHYNPTTQYIYSSSQASSQSGQGAQPAPISAHQILTPNELKTRLEQLKQKHPHGPWGAMK